MSHYVDGFVIPVPKKNLDRYREVAEIARDVWMKHGALQYVETVGDDLDIAGMRPFPEAAGLKDGEVVIFSWILYRSREHRDEVNAKVMEDPRMREMMQEEVPFMDCKRMAYGGFRLLTQAGLS